MKQFLFWNFVFALNVPETMFDSIITTLSAAPEILIFPTLKSKLE